MLFPVLLRANSQPVCQLRRSRQIRNSQRWYFQWEKNLLFRKIRGLRGLFDGGCSPDVPSWPEQRQDSCRLATACTSRKVSNKTAERPTANQPLKRKIKDLAELTMTEINSICRRRLWKIRKTKFFIENSALTETKDLHALAEWRSCGNPLWGIPRRRRNWWNSETVEGFPELEHWAKRRSQYVA